MWRCYKCKHQRHKRRSHPNFKGWTLRIADTLHHWCSKHRGYLPVWHFTTGPFEGYQNNCSKCYAAMQAVQKRREGPAYQERKADKQRARRAQVRASQRRAERSLNRDEKVRKELGIATAVRRQRGAPQPIRIV